jgi:hypothetical protein
MISKSEHQKAVAEARAEGAASERARMQSILTAPEARGHEATAIALALQPTVTADAAQIIMGADTEFSRGREIARRTLPR